MGSDKVRSFVAIGVSNDVQGRLESIVNELRMALSNVKWVEPRNYHLTIKFLGEIPRERIPEVSGGLEAASKRLCEFDIELKGVGAFPDIRRPRVIWVGIGAGIEEFRKLWQAVEEELSRRGFEKEPKGFSPHLTLGRIRHPGPPAPKLSEIVEMVRNEPLGRIRVNELLLMRSELSSRGPDYTLIEKHVLEKRIV